MSHYPYGSIVVNGKEISIDSILNGTAGAVLDFEQTTFTFIADWLSGRENFLQNTSGSTGDPRPIVIKRSQMIASASLSIGALGLSQGYNALLCISPEYIGGKMMLVRSLMAGMKIIATTPTSNPFNSLPENIQVDFAAMVPYQIHEIVQSAAASKFDDVKKIIIGGATLDRQTEARLQGYRCIFYSTFGMTETVSHIALRQLNGLEASDSYRALPGIKISTDERSCLQIEWDQLGEKVITNDIVEIISNDTFRWVGRWDNVINTGGVKVIPEKLEEDIYKIFNALGIPNAFFVGSVTDAGLGNKVALFVEGLLEEDVIEKIKIRMVHVMSKMEVPKHVILVKSFALTENGKINRKATTIPYMDGM
ncbi:MAG TPA: AMP-binding protein [Chryseolinea sp.]|nr:AMP-binding protein [Chryseolinea sp.]